MRSFVTLVSDEIEEDLGENNSLQRLKNETHIPITKTESDKGFFVAARENNAEFALQKNSTEALSIPPRHTEADTFVSQWDGNMKVEDRLLNMGKIYTERRLKRKKEEEDRKQEAEQAIVNQINAVKISSGREPVENRLQEYSKFYTNKRMEKERELKEKEAENYQGPIINEHSQEIVQELKWIPRVEDRLTYYGQKAKFLREENQKIAEQQIQERARPQILMSSRLICSSESLKNSKERLLSARKTERESTDNKWKFAPDLSEKTRRLAQKQHLRSSSMVKLNSSRPEFSFRPEISKNSVKILKSPGRKIVNQRTKSVNRSECSFAPKLNHESVEIDRKQRKGDRCEYLYNLSERQRENLCMKQKVAEQKKEEQEKYSFQPKLIAKNNKCTLNDKLNYQVNKDQKPEVKLRTHLWNELRKEKLQIKIQAEQEKEMSLCSFKPEICHLRQKSNNRSSLAHQSAKKSLGCYSDQRVPQSVDRRNENNPLQTGTDLLGVIQSLHNDILPSSKYLYLLD